MLTIQVRPSAGGKVLLLTHREESTTFRGRSKRLFSKYLFHDSSYVTNIRFQKVTLSSKCDFLGYFCLNSHIVERTVAITSWKYDSTFHATQKKNAWCAKTLSVL